MERCPICNQDWPSSAIEEHHIIERAESRALGERVNNNAYNLVKICASHHSMITRGEIETERKVQTTDGLKLMWRYKGGEWQFS